MKAALLALIAFSAINLAAIIPTMIYLMVTRFDAGPPLWIFKWLMVAALPLLPAVALLILCIATGRI